MKKKNPWLGLVSYDEPKGNDDYLFCGRDEDTLDVARLIDNNLFVTLYGSSGIGKTSLLKAGVIPILRRKDYFPLYVRLSQEPGDVPYAESIVRRLRDSGLREHCSVGGELPGGEDRLFLWNYFAITRFFNEEGREVYPVIILDQFEEVFRDADKRKAELLLRQIYLLLNDELEMPAEDGYSADTNYRFLASIREDFLFVLEDSIDALSMDLLKNNRYRLRPMDAGNAREVVLMPGRDCIVEAEKEAVADRIVALAGHGKKEGIDTLLLSLVCACTYDKKAGERITLSDLSMWKDNPMLLYYQDAVNNLSAKQIRYIQQHFVREDGSRRRVDAVQVRAALGENCFAALAHGENRMFADAGQGQVELLHDQLAMAVYDDRKAFEERERKRKLKRRIWLFGSLGFLILLSFLVFLFIIGDQQNDLLKNQARFTAERIERLADDGDLHMAMLLALEVLPDQFGKSGKYPYTPEAEASLRSVLRHQDAVLRSHGGSVDKICFAPAGDRFLVVDSKVRVWDFQTGKCLKTIDITEGYANAGAFCPDGRLIGYSIDSLVLLFDLEQNHCIDTLKGHTHTVKDLDFNPSGALIASASKDNDVRIWEVSTGRCLQVLEGHGDDVHSICFSPCGKYVVTSSTDRTIRIWTVSDGKCLRVIRHTAELSDARISPDGTMIASGSWDNSVCLWDFNTGRRLSVMPTPPKDDPSGVYAVSFSPDGKTVAAAYSDDPGLVRLWDVTTGKCIRTWEGHSEGAHAVSFSPDGEYVVSGSYDETVRIWKVLDEPEGIVLEGFKPSGSWIGSASSVAFRPDGRQVLVAYSDGIGFWDAETYRYLDTIREQHGRVIDAQYSPDGQFIASARQDGTIRIWDAEEKECINSMYHSGEISSISFSHDSGFLAVASWNDSVSVWSVPDGCKELEFPNPDNPSCAVFSPDDRFVASGSNDGTVRVWEIRTQQCIHTLEGHSSYVNGVAFSPDGWQLASASRDGTVRIWDMVKGSCLRCIELGPEGCFSVEYSSDGKYLLVSYGKLVMILDSSTGVVIQTFEGHYDTVDVSCFSPDGRRIISASYEYDARIWDFPPLQELIDQTRDRMKGRTLTQEEKRKYYLD